MRTHVLALALMLGGCASMESMNNQSRLESEINVAPENYKADIVAAMRTFLNDPTNVRDAYVSEPVLKGVDGGRRYMSCVRYNAKRTGGQYAGIKDNIITFRGGKLDRIIDGGNARESATMLREQCKDAAYVRFPELEQLTR